MLAHSAEIQTLDDLKAYVNETLRHFDRLEADAFQMTERILMRGNNPCGMYFCLHGPRAVLFSAIWETDRNTVLFYGSNGERLHKTQLVEAPVLELAMA